MAMKNLKGLRDMAERKVLTYLKEQATAIIRKAQSDRYYKNPGEHLRDITGTQDSAYGAMIFKDGKLTYTLRITPGKANLNNNPYQVESVWDEVGKHRGYAKWGIPDGTGPEWADILRNEVKSGAWGKIPETGFCLIVFNAAFYSVVHEKKWQYKVLSTIATDLEAVGSNFKGAALTWKNLNEQDRQW